MKYKVHKGNQRYLIILVCLFALNCLVMQSYAEDKQATKSDQPTKSVTTKKARQLFYPALTEREEKLQAALHSETEANFPEIPLEEAATYLSELHNVPIKIQAKALDDIDISAEEPIDVHLSKISLKNALLYILDPIELTYVVDREMILITSKGRASEMMKTRVYPVGDLCSSSPDDYQALEEAILNTNLGEWKSKKPRSVPGGFGGGAGPQVYINDIGGTISVVPQSKSLVISQTYHAQNAIVDLLTQLRQARSDQQRTTGEDL